MKKNNPNLTNEQKSVLFEEGTEPPGSSELNNEKREGSYHCANCGVKLFESNTKYESGSGWPSFFQSLPDVFETKTIFVLLLNLDYFFSYIVFLFERAIPAIINIAPRK